MKTNRLVLFLLAVATGSLILFSGCNKENDEMADRAQTTEMTDMKASENGPSANGHGNIIYEQGYQRHFSFHANTMPNGTVKGNGMLTFNGGFYVKFNVDCLMVEDNMATMSGVIVNHSGNPDLIGHSCWFRVVDHGEGENADPDQITLFVFAVELDDCTVDLGEPYNFLYEIDGGNIQVKP